VTRTRRQTTEEPEQAAGLGGFLRRRRVDLGLTQEAVSDAAGIGRSHLSQIESGKIGLPNAAIRRRLARALALQHVDLLIAAGELDEDEVRDGRQPLASELDRIAERLGDEDRAALLAIARRLAR
jgi:transcriptional regulator with XRE-family HTH domain